MKNKYLIFRTDRIGDLLVCAILIKSIKENDLSSEITLITSDKNHFYAKNFPFIDQTFLLKNNFFSKLSLILKLRRCKFNTIIIHDNKNRSKIISFFLKYKKKIVLKRQEMFSHIDNIKFILKKMNFLFRDESLNILSHKKNKSNETKKVQLHFDEKWIHKNYIQKFINIEPNESELFDFVKKLHAKSKLELIITTGNNIPLVLKNILPKIYDLNIKVYDKLDFNGLEKITLKSTLLISCHGAISHIASANEISQIDIIDKSYNYKRWTDHFRNYTFIYRDKFLNLTEKIIQKL